MTKNVHQKYLNKNQILKMNYFFISKNFSPLLNDDLQKKSVDISSVWLLKHQSQVIVIVITMVKTRETSTEINQLILKLHLERMSISDVSTMNVPKSIVNYILSKLATCGTLRLSNGRRSGRQWVSSADDDRKILWIVKKDPLTTGKQRTTWSMLEYVSV